MEMALPNYKRQPNEAHYKTKTQLLLLEKNKIPNNASSPRLLFYQRRHELKTMGERKAIAKKLQ